MLGLAELFHGFRLYWLFRGKKPFACSVLFLKEETAERQMAYAAEQLLWNGSGFADCVIADGGGLSEEKQKLCRTLAERYPIVFCGDDKAFAEALDAFRLKPM